jgi:hypothetical protein
MTTKLALVRNRSSESPGAYWHGLQQTTRYVRSVRRGLGYPPSGVRRQAETSRGSRPSTSWPPSVAQRYWGGRRNTASPENRVDSTNG